MNLVKKNEKLIEKGLEFYSKGNFRLAEKCFYESYKFFIRNNKKNLASKALRYLTDLFLELERDDKALEYLKELLKIYNELKNFKKSSEAIINIGRVYRRLGNHQLSRQFYKQALELCEKNEYELGKAYIIFNISEDLKYEGKLEDALRNYNKIGKVFENFKEYDKLVAVYLSKLHILRMINNIEPFKSVIYSIERFLPHTIDNRTKANSLINLALNFHYLQNYDKSNFYLHKSIEISKKLGIQSIQAHALMNRGYNHISLKDFKTAEQDLNSALILFKKLDSLEEIGRVYNGLGLLYLEKDELDDAINSLEVSLEFAEKSNENLLKIRNYMLLEEIYSKKGDNVKRFKVLTHFMKVLDLIMDNFQDPFLKGKFFENFLDYKRTYSKLEIILQTEGLKIERYDLEEIELIAEKSCKIIRATTDIEVDSSDYITLTRDLISIINDMKGKYLESDARNLYSKIGYDMEWMKHNRTINEEERKKLIDNGCYKGHNPPMHIEIDIYGKIVQRNEIVTLIGEAKNRRKRFTKKMLECFIIKANIIAKYETEYHKHRDNIEPKFHIFIISTGDFEDNININDFITDFWDFAKGRLINRTIDLIDYQEFIRLMNDNRMDVKSYKKIKKFQEKYKKLDAKI